MKQFNNGFYSDDIIDYADKKKLDYNRRILPSMFPPFT